MTEELYPEVDLDLHGSVGIRLINARPSDLAAVTRQLGQIQGSLSRQPDILIEFVDQLPTSSPLNFVDVGDTAFTDDAFLVLRSKHKTRAMVQIPFAQIGHDTRIVCESGLTAVPLLIPVLNLTALQHGLLPLHASAFDYEGVGVLTTGWSKGGKTETLLAFVARGAKYIGDEWIYVTQDGQRMFGVAEPIRVWDWHLRSLPRYWTALDRKDKVRLHTLKTLVRILDRKSINSNVWKTSAGRWLKRVTLLLNQQLHVDVPPLRLFGADREAQGAKVDKVIFVANHSAPEISAKHMDPVDIARRMVFSLQEERRNFMSYYHKFRFAFPEACNPMIEQVQDVERAILTRLLADKEAHAVYHPYPVDLPALFTAIEPLLYRNN